MEIQKRQLYRSEPFVNMSYDMERVCLIGTRNEVRAFLKENNYFKEEKQDENNILSNSI